MAILHKLDGDRVTSGKPGRQEAGGQ